MTLLRYINSFEEVVGIPILLIYFSIIFSIVRKTKLHNEDATVKVGIIRNN